MKSYVQALQRGDVVACATETFFGLLADINQPQAIEHVLALKGRSEQQPMAVLLPDIEAVAHVALPLGVQARALAAQYWPGPLTLVHWATGHVHPALVRDGKVGFRVPGCSAALDLVRAFGGALTATSANKTGQPALHTSAEVLGVFAGQLLQVIPGHAPGGLATTILDVTQWPPRCLRQGAVVLPAQT